MLAYCHRSLIWSFCEEFALHLRSWNLGQVCDLANGTDALSVADAVLNVAHRIIDDFGVRHVTVCSVLHRKYPHDINTEIDTYNNVLRHFCDVETNIDYHTHRGFWQTPNESWSRDGLHPNTPCGRLGALHEPFPCIGLYNKL